MGGIMKINKTLAAFKREIKEKVFSKMFLFTTFFIPILMIGIIFFQKFLAEYDSNDSFKVVVFTESKDLFDVLLQELSSSQQKENIYFDIRYGTRENFQKFIKSNIRELYKEEIKAALFMPDFFVSNKKIELYAKKPNNQKLLTKIANFYNKAFLNLFLNAKNLNETDIEFIKKEIEILKYEVKDNSSIEKSGYGRQALSFIIAFILYLSLLFNGNLLMQSVIEEKNSRIVEVLLSSIESKELLLSKVLGTFAAAFFQLLVWLAGIITTFSGAFIFIPEEIRIDLTYNIVFYFALNFALGLFLFLTLFATVGSMFENAQETQSAIMPLLLLIIIPFFASISLLENPDNKIAMILSAVPIFSIIIMPVRLAIAAPEIWEIVISFIGNIIAAVIILWIGGKIYSFSILITGKKVNFNDIINFFKIDIKKKV